MDDPPAVVSHRSAAAVHGLGDLEADQLEFTVPGRKQSRREDVRLHRLPIEPGEWTVVDGIPVTTIVRTIGDLAAARIDGGHLAGVVRDAVTRHQVDDHQISQVLRRHAHRYGAPMGDGEALLARLLREAGMPESVERAVELVAGSPTARWHAAQADQLRRISEQVDQISRSATAPTAAKIAEIVNSSGLREALQNAMSIAQGPGVQALATSVESARRAIGSVDPDAVRAITAAVNSPAIKNAASHQAELVRADRAARAAAREAGFTYSRADERDA